MFRTIPRPWTHTTRDRQPDEASRRNPGPEGQRSDRHGLLSHLGMELAPQPPRDVQPRLSRPRRQSVGPQAPRHHLERQQVGRRCSGLSPDHGPTRPEIGNLMKRRGGIQDPKANDPTGMGFYPTWAWSWPLNRRVMYNRASADLDGKAWDPKRPGITWNGSKWVGDVPDYPPTMDPHDPRSAT